MISVNMCRYNSSSNDNKKSVSLCTSIPIKATPGVEMKTGTSSVKPLKASENTLFSPKTLKELARKIY